MSTTGETGTDGINESIDPTNSNIEEKSKIETKLEKTATQQNKDDIDNENEIKSEMKNESKTESKNENETDATVTTGATETTIRKQKAYNQKQLHKERLYNEYMKEPDVVIMREGLAKFYKTPNVFYNPAMSTNRDVSVAAIETYAKLVKSEYEEKGKKFTGLKIFEGLSATGLRSIRYLQEIEQDLIDFVQINDISETACELIDENLRLNNISLNDDKAVVTCGDCNIMLMQHSL